MRVARLSAYEMVSVGQVLGFTDGFLHFIRASRSLGRRSGATRYPSQFNIMVTRRGLVREA